MRPTTLDMEVNLDDVLAANPVVTPTNGDPDDGDDGDDGNDDESSDDEDIDEGRDNDDEAPGGDDGDPENHQPDVATEDLAMDVLIEFHIVHNAPHIKDVLKAHGLYQLHCVFDLLHINLISLTNSSGPM